MALISGTKTLPSLKRAPPPLADIAGRNWSDALGGWPGILDRNRLPKNENHHLRTIPTFQSASCTLVKKCQRDSIFSAIPKEMVALETQFSLWRARKKSTQTGTLTFILSLATSNYMQLPSTLRNSSRLGQFEWHTVHQPTPKSLLAKLRSKMPEVKLLVGETSRLQTQRKLKAPLKKLPASTKLQVFSCSSWFSCQPKKLLEPSFSNKRKASKWWELIKPFPFWDFVASWASSLVPKPGPKASPWVPTSSATEIIVQKGAAKNVATKMLKGKKSLKIIYKNIWCQVSVILIKGKKLYIK